jgi:response regulator RpfG family c-di-GMP phosphodiesterase
MRTHQPDALRFILTAYPAFESALEAIREEVHDYLIKPTETEVLVEKILSQLAKRTPEQSILRQRLPQVIRANRESIVEHWSQRVKEDPEIGSISVSDSERREYVPLLLDVATGVAEGNPPELGSVVAVAQVGGLHQTATNDGPPDSLSTAPVPHP